MDDTTRQLPAAPPSTQTDTEAPLPPIATDDVVFGFFINAQPARDTT